VRLNLTPRRAAIDNNDDVSLSKHAFRKTKRRDGIRDYVFALNKLVMQHVTGGGLRGDDGGGGGTVDAKRISHSIPLLIMSSSIVSRYLLRSAGAATTPLNSDDNRTRRRMRRNEATTRRRACVRAFSFWRDAGPIVAHYKFAEVWLRLSNAGVDKRDDVWNRLHDLYSPKSIDIILNLRGLYIKIGQVLSSRPDFIPRQYVDVFSTVQDSVPPRPFDEVKSMVEESLELEQGLQFDQVFSSFDAEAIGSASIGQVHCATLCDDYYTRITPEHHYSGDKTVAVKVMHPSAQSQFSNDFKVFKWLCRIALPGWMPIVRELQKIMATEFDYVNEAASLREVRDNMARSVYRKLVKIPEPVDGLCSRNLLVMEFIDGTKLADAIEEEFTNVVKGDKDVVADILRERRRELFIAPSSNNNIKSQRDLLQELVLSTQTNTSKEKKNLFYQTLTLARLMSLTRRVRKTLELLVDVHGHQILINGCFNSDPHPGNILLLKDGRTLGLIDYGQVRRLDTRDRLALCEVIRRLGSTDDDDVAVACAMKDFGFESRFGKSDVMSRVAALYFDTDEGGRQLGFMNPQFYLEYLLNMDPIVTVPDAAVMVARTSFLFRGMGTLLQQDIRTAQRWAYHAETALNKASSL